ncbi:MAG: hypothetical protein K6G47_11970 [Clostridia bacterium]|nr:hypothetical protein [Clostridia bacterium]
MNFKKMVSLILISSAVLGMALNFSACKKNNKPRESNYIIQESDPWYNANIYKPFEIIDPYNEIMNASYYSAIVGDKLFISKSGSYYYENLNDYAYAQMYGLFDLEGNFICQYLLERAFEFEDDTFIGVKADGDELDIMFSGVTDNDLESRIFSVRWDTDSNTLGEPVQMNLDFQGEYLMQAKRCDDILVMTDYSYTDILSSDTMDMALNIYEGTELLGRLELSDTECDYIYVNDVYEKDGKIIIDCENWNYIDYYSGEKVRIVFDKTSRTFEEISSYYSEGIGNKVRGFDGRFYYAKRDGIYCDDELYLSFADCDINLTDALDMDLLGVEEDRILISDYDYFDDLMEGYRIIALEKQNRNPNAGKMVINALAATVLKNEQYEAILRYNRADNKYFIRPVVKAISENSLCTSDVLQQYYDSLAEEIKSDNGPDLVLNAHVLSSFINEGYFLDLSKDIKFDDENYYSEIYDLTATDGKHYLIPSGFLVTGSMVPSEYLEKGQHGFTYDEYKEFVSTCCDGVDPITYSHTRKRYLEVLLNAMGDSWLKDGKVDFDTEEFRALLSYVKDFVPATEYEDDRGYFTEYIHPYPSPKKSPAYNFLYDANFSSYTSELIGDPDLELCGIPSYERTGPVAQIVSSASVCANTGVLDGCVDFIKYLLSTEIQLNNVRISVNKNAMSILQSTNYQKDAREFKDNLAKLQSEAQDRDDNYYAPLKDTQKQVDSFTDDFECAAVYDMTVVYIIIEESRGYLDGNEDIDTVISSINTKVQSYLDSLG